MGDRIGLYIQDILGDQSIVCKYLSTLAQPIKINYNIRVLLYYNIALLLDTILARACSIPAVVVRAAVFYPFAARLVFTIFSIFFQTIGHFEAP